MAWLIWLTAFVVLIGIEAVTMALTTIWFAGGAIVAFLLAIFGAGIYVQTAAFFIVSCILLFFTRPIALRYVNQKTVKTNVEELIGKKGRVTEAIDNDLARGAVLVSGQEWTARSEDDAPIEAGAMVRIDAVRGVKLIVERLKEES